MPQIETWSHLPAAVCAHIVERMHDRSLEDLNQLPVWIESKPVRDRGTKTLARSSCAGRVHIREPCGFFLTINHFSSTGIGLFQLQETDATHASLSAISAPPIELRGSDGENLVHLYSRTDPTALYWSEAP
jgi:hypothetical protein